MFASLILIEILLTNIYLDFLTVAMNVKIEAFSKSKI